MTMAGMLARWSLAHAGTLVLTMLSVAATLALLSFAAMADPHVQRATTEAGKRRLVSVNRINFTNPLPQAYAERIGEMEGVEVATHATWMGLFHPEPKDTIAAFAIEPQTYFKVFPNIEMAASTREAFLSNRNGLLLGRRLAERTGLRARSLVRLGSNIYGDEGFEFRIAGTFTVRNDEDATDYALAQYEYFDRSRAFKNGTIGQVVFLSRAASMNDTVARQVDDLFAHSQTETVTETFEAFHRAFAANMGSLATSIRWCGWGALLSTLLAITSSLLFETRLRSTEFALLKVLGFPFRARALFTLMPAMAAALAGVALGTAAACAFVTVMILLDHEHFRGLTVTAAGGLELFLAAAALGVLPALPALWVSNAVAAKTGMSRSS